MAKTKEIVIKGTRWSGADWASETREIILVGVGGIGSWTALNLSRIGHSLYIFDPDTVDETNVLGGQMYKKTDVGSKKVLAVQRMCRDMGCSSSISAWDREYKVESGIMPIMITGLDNMKARKDVFNAWYNRMVSDCKDAPERRKDYLLIDGRLLMEHMEVFALRGDDTAGIEEYRTEHLFDDSEVKDADCTTKQSTFAAMMIAGMITATLCNFLTNRKLGEEMREVPFHQKLFLPIFAHSISSSKRVEIPEVRIEGVMETEKVTI